MKKSNWKAYALWLVLTEAIGGISGWLTAKGMQIFQNTIKQSPLTPPGIAFPIVWTILFALMGIGAAKIYLAPPSAMRTKSIIVFLLQLIFNFFWSIIFFNLQNFLFAFIWLIVLWALILLMIFAFNKVDKTAARFQIPYFIWVTFAAYLNLSVLLLN